MIVIVAGGCAWSILAGLVVDTNLVQIISIAVVVEPIDIISIAIQVVMSISSGYASATLASLIWITGLVEVISVAKIIKPVNIVAVAT